MQLKSQQWEEDIVQNKVPAKQLSSSSEANPPTNKTQEVGQDQSISSQSEQSSNSSQSSDEEQELQVDLPKKEEKGQEDEWGDESNFETQVQKQKKPLVRGNQSNQEKPFESQNNQNTTNSEKPQRGNTNFELNEQPQQVRVVNNFFGNRQDDEDQDNGFKNRGNGFQSRGRGRGNFRGGRGGFGGNFGNRDNFDSRGRGRGRGRGNFRGGFGNREGGFNSRGGDSFNSNSYQSDTQATFNQHQYNQNSQQFTQQPSFNPIQYNPNQQYVNPQDAFRKKSQGPIYVSNYQQPIQQVPSLHGSRVVNIPQSTAVLNESLQMSMIRATDCDILEDEPEMKSEKGKISAQRKKWNLQKIKPEGRKAWPTMSIKILSKTLQVTYRRISEHSACVVVIPITDLIFNIYPGTIIHQSDINYKEILQSKWERIQSPGSVYIKESHLPKNFRFVGLAFIKISEAQQSITNGLSRLFQSLREMARSQNKQSGLGNIVIPLSLFKDHQNKYEKFIVKISEMMEKKENDFINQISLTTKDPSEYQQASNVFSKLTLKMIKNFEICVDQ